MNRLIIKQKLPSMNDIININRKNKYMGAKLKRDIEDVIGYMIKQALNTGELQKTENKSDILIIWYCKDKRRDADNVQSSCKFIMDALVKNGILVDDGRKYVEQIYHIMQEGEEDYCEVYIYDTGILRLEEERK